MKQNIGMELFGNLRKMRTELKEPVEYQLRVFDKLKEKDAINLTELVGTNIQIKFTGNIHCVVTGEKIKKVYGEGMSYKAFMESPQASESIIRPELSQAHLGIGLRDLDWEIEHHVKPHVVYLARTAGTKVGVTRQVQKYHRWMDQGAVEALVFAETPYRQAAGIIEVALKKKISDKTSWQKMLTNTISDNKDLRDLASELKKHVPADHREFLVKEGELVKIKFPVLEYPKKVSSLKLDKSPEIEGKLMGIKGQYLIFEGGKVFNVRSHSGYEVEIRA